MAIDKKRSLFRAGESKTAPELSDKSLILIINMEGGSNPTKFKIMKFSNEKKEKNWIIKSEDTPEFISKISSIATALGINPVVAKLLYNRGYRDEVSAKSFINASYEKSSASI